MVIRITILTAEIRQFGGLKVNRRPFIFKGNQRHYGTRYHSSSKEGLAQRMD